MTGRTNCWFIECGSPSQLNDGHAQPDGPTRRRSKPPDVEGLVSLTDVISSIVGDLPTQAGEEPSIVQRDDGSWLLDRELDLDTALRVLDAESMVRDEDRRHYHTLGGLAMLALGYVPRTGDVFERGKYRFEVVDMDGNRVDWVLATRLRSRTQ